MVNEEKTIELVKQFQSCMNNGVSKDAAVMACLMEMAEWKDQNFAEEKKQWIGKACEWLRRTQPKSILPDTTIGRFK